MKLSETLAQAIESTGVQAKWKKDLSGTVQVNQGTDLVKLVKALSKQGEFHLLEGVLSVSTDIYFLIFSQRHNVQMALQMPAANTDVQALTEQVRGALNVV